MSLILSYLIPHSQPLYLVCIFPFSPRREDNQYYILVVTLLGPVAEFLADSIHKQSVNQIIFLPSVPNTAYQLNSHSKHNP